MECGLGEWYPLVGLDSPHAIHFNFGQEPFRYDVVDEFYKESEGMAGLLANQLQWYTISDSDGETSASEEDEAMGESDADESNFDDDDDDEMFDAEFITEHFLELHGVYHDLDDLDDYYDGDADDTESELEFVEDDDEASMDEA
uniref:Uncharacterized protein n=1 Tax=Globisporangium ultimum (strain ATCC 200006 / CBS 805.95 / DAOM BR144) TaxID=431595 RepID=K3W6V4_GLOUD